MNKQNIIITALSIGIVALGVLAIIKANESRQYLSSLKTAENNLSWEKQNFQSEKRGLEDTIRVLREAVTALAEIKQLAEQRHTDSIERAGNEQERLDRITLSRSRIEKFANIFMKGISPTSHESLETAIDTANMTYDFYLKTLSVPFTIKWHAFKYGIFVREDAKSLHEFQGKYTIGASYNEYIESVYQNSALKEGIKARKGFEQLVSGLSNFASIMESIDRVDKALNK